jgi:DNA repair protein RadC
VDKYTLLLDKTNQSISIKNWNLDDRPREKLLHKGTASLSNAEIMAILIGSGNKDESAVALSRRILASVENDLGALGKLSINDLLKFKGIGQAKAVSILAAAELGRRRRLQDATKSLKITSARDVFEVMQPLIGELGHEEFWILYLTNANKIIEKFQVSKGGITGTLVDIRLVLKQAIQLGATAMIVSHNHPSGNLKPSTADKQLTLKLKESCAQLDISLLDHLIITEKDYFSFADNSLL